MSDEKTEKPKDWLDDAETLLIGAWDALGRLGPKLVREVKILRDQRNHYIQNFDWVSGHLEELLELNPNCPGCGVRTILPEDMPPVVKGLDTAILNSMATLDHVLPRADPRRTKQTSSSRTRLLCHGCNQRLARVQNYGSYNTERFRVVANKIARGNAGGEHAGT